MISRVSSVTITELFIQDMVEYTHNIMTVLKLYSTSL